MANWHQGEIVAHQQWTENLFTIKIRYPHDDFIPGQFVRLALTQREDRIQRAYSLVNPPGQGIAEIYYTKVEQGKLTDPLTRMRVGDKIDISHPASGFFTLDEVPDGENLWLISTGTGIGPYLSMLSTPTPWQRFKQIILIHGVRWAMDLTYQQQIRDWQTTYGLRLHYVPIVSRERAPHCLHGHLTTHLEDGNIQRLTAQPLDNRSQVMLCGNPDMIAQCKAWLLNQGLEKNLRRKPGHITTEQYW